MLLLQAEEGRVRGEGEDRDWRASEAGAVFWRGIERRIRSKSLRMIFCSSGGKMIIPENVW